MSMVDLTSSSDREPTEVDQIRRESQNMDAASVGIQGQAGQQVETGYDAFQEIGTGDFLKLIVAELQNQDPMNPTDTADMLNQFNQIREISSNDKLTETLEGVLLGQNIATGSSLIGKLVEGMTAEGEKIIGQVDAVTVHDNEPSLLVSGSYVTMNNILQIIDPELISADDLEQAVAEGDEVDETTDDSSDETTE
jgi:flagellar hook assembly protein FlgD